MNKVKRMRLGLLFLAVSMGWLAACQKETEAPGRDFGEFVSHTDAGLGLALEYPETWAVSESMVGLTLASTEETLNIETFDQLGEEGVMVILPGEIDVLAFQTNTELDHNDPLPILDIYQELLRKEGQELLVVSETESFTIDGQPAAKIILQSREGTVTLEITMAAVLNEGYVALISAAAIKDSAASLRPVFADIIDTIHVTPPNPET